MHSTFSSIHKSIIARKVLSIFTPLLVTSLCMASPSDTSMQDLLLWNVDPTQYQTIDTTFSSDGCTTIPTLTSGQMYHLNLLNQTGEALSDPLPLSFLTSVSLQALNVSGMRMEVSSLDGLLINDDAAITLEIIPIRTGSWDIGCSNQPIVTAAAPYPFPLAQPTVQVPDGFLKVPKPLTEFELIQENAQRLNHEILKKRWTILFFGYTFCPDICPTNLFNLALAYDDLPSVVKDKLDIVFVSVDPGRDKPKALKQYVQHFHNDFSGVSGTSKQIANLAEQLSVSYRLPKNRSSKDYAVAHTADYFLLSPDVRLVARINHERQPTDIATTIKTAVSYFKLVIDHL